MKIKHSILLVLFWSIQLMAAFQPREEREKILRMLTVEGDGNWEEACNTTRAQIDTNTSNLDTYRETEREVLGLGGFQARFDDEYAKLVQKRDLLKDQVNCYCRSPSTESKDALSENFLKPYITQLQRCFVTLDAAIEMIKSGTTLWITYNNKLDGQGDAFIAAELSRRIERLGYKTAVYNTDSIELASFNPHLKGIIHLPDPYQFPHLLNDSLLDVPFAAFVESGYDESLQEFRLGLGQGEQGLLLDESLMQRYREGLENREAVILHSYRALSEQVRGWLDSALEIHNESELADKLSRADFYFGYSKYPRSKEVFERMVGRERDRRRNALLLLGNASRVFQEENPVDNLKILKMPALQHEDFLNLLSISKLALVTGECSLAEALSVGVPIIWEEVENKKRVTAHLLSLLERYPNAGLRVLTIGGRPPIQETALRAIDFQNHQAMVQHIHDRHYLNDERLEEFVFKVLRSTRRGWETVKLEHFNWANRRISGVGGCGLQ